MYNCRVETTAIIKTYIRGEDKTKAPEKEMYLQLDPIWKKVVWAFKYTNPKGKVTIYRAKSDSNGEKQRLAHILETGIVPGRGNIYHPENRTLRMPLWLGKFKFLTKSFVQST